MSGLNTRQRPADGHQPPRAPHWLNIYKQMRPCNANTKDDLNLTSVLYSSLLSDMTNGFLQIGNIKSV